MPATEPQPQPPSQAQPSRPFTLAGLSMRDLLASCAAADAVSTPPRLPDPGLAEEPVRHPEAA
ncbi:hypothetical protein ABZ725_01505 [Streptomyces sp. NPDC006872]|uniref:hypothetical protein n=1 Tax=Streptomyces sp. NPDC006872 TaxID=3155720 RepID=UPI00340ED34B